MVCDHVVWPLEFWEVVDVAIGVHAVILWLRAIASSTRTLVRVLDGCEAWADEVSVYKSFASVFSIGVAFVTCRSVDSCWSFLYRRSLPKPPHPQANEELSILQLSVIRPLWRLLPASHILGLAESPCTIVNMACTQS
jgi:hypothetical protein